MPRRRRLFHLPAGQRRLVSILLGGFLVMLLNSLVLVLFDRSSALLYMSNVLLHVGLGLLLCIPFLIFLAAHLRTMPIGWNRWATAAGIFTALSISVLLGSGIVLFFGGSTLAQGWVLTLHVVTAVTSLLGFAVHVSLKRGRRYRFLLPEGLSLPRPTQLVRHPLMLTLGAGLIVSVAFFLVPWLKRPQPVYVDMGEENPLRSSQAVLAHEGFLKEAALSGSKTCGQAGCHPDIYAQWEASAHHFSSFNNPYYRRSIEYMLERRPVEAARWCASCHDPVMLFSGRFGHRMPLDTTHWTAHEGITCLSCHAITGLRDLRGNGRYVIAEPDEYPFARSTSPLGQWLHRQLILARPEPHRQAMLRPVHRTEQFCSTCHKVGLPPDVNYYRWLRGQNEYDAWQMSGVSGNTVRSFYLPNQARTCIDCHMPLVPSDDKGNDGGFVRSHRFLAANTALPFLKGHDEQLRATQAFLQDSIATVDLFLVRVNGRTYGPDEPMPVLRPGDQVELTVVVRNRKVGHALPGGTNDSNELWLEVVGRDGQGQVVVASGLLDEEGRVDSTAHFFGAVFVDRAGQEANKRNPHDFRTPVYVNVIGPGTARTVHYRFTVPAGRPLTELAVAFKHRKFKWYFHNWTFRGQVAPGEADSLATPEVDYRRWILAEDQQAPALPITTLATARRIAGQPPESCIPLWERWNDYAIGLFLEGNNRRALDAFEQVSRLNPQSPEGPINLARVLIAEGQLARAAEALAEAERRRPGYLKTAYFRGQIYQRQGEYDQALAEWMKVLERYPLDRVLLQDIGRIHYLSGRYEEALRWFDRILAIDPEDLGGLYNRMLALGALGRTEEFLTAKARYEYHKVDEEASAWSTPYKHRHPMANREAQAIHEHELHPVVPQTRPTRQPTIAWQSPASK